MHLKEVDYQPTRSLLYCLTARNMGNQLSEKQVNEILEQNFPDATTDELYSFGLSIVQEAMEQYHRYDSKATKIAGYSGAVMALLLTQFAEWSKSLDWWAIPILFLAALVALVAAGFGLGAIALREIPWYSPRDWFRVEVLDDSNLLRKYHILCMYLVRQSYMKESARKTVRVNAAYRSLLLAGVLLLVAFLDGTARRVQHREPSPRIPIAAVAPRTGTGGSQTK